MDPVSIGAILSGLGQFAGGASSLFGGGRVDNSWAARLAQDNFNRQIQLQKDFAQQGIQWRVADAKAAGIHPLYALSGGGAAYSPQAVSVGGGSESGPDMGRDLANMGAGIGRAVAATSSKEDRSDAAYQSTMRVMGMERARLENTLLETQILAAQSALNRAQVGPGMPTGRSGAFDIKPAEITSNSPERPGAEAGPQQPGNRYVSVSPGGNVVTPLPAKEMNFDELSTPGTATWQFWNTIAPFFSSDAREAGRPPRSMLPPNKDYWEWTPMGYVARKYAPWQNHPRRPGVDAWTGPRASTHRYSNSGAER